MWLVGMHNCYEGVKGRKVAYFHYPTFRLSKAQNCFLGNISHLSQSCNHTDHEMPIKQE